MRDKGGEHALLHQFLCQLLVHSLLLPQLYLRVVQGQPQHTDEACDSHSPYPEGTTPTTPRQGDA